MNGPFHALVVTRAFCARLSVKSGSVWRRKISCFSHGVWARTREKTVVSEFKRFRNGVNGYRGLIVSVAIVPVSMYSCYFDGYYFLSNQSEVPRHMKPSISATGLYQVFSKMTLIISLPMRVASGNRGSKYFEMRSKRSW